MRKIHTIILSLLLVPSMAIAQQGPQPRPAPERPSRPGPDRPWPGANRPNPGQGSNRPTPLPRPLPGRPTPGTPHPGGPSPGRPNPGHGTRPPGRPDPGHRPQPGKPNPGRPQPDRPGYHRPGAGRPPQFRPIHGPTFRYPRGYRYRRWSVGLLLPSLFLSSPYIYQSWSTLGLEPPPPGYYWVRYGPDLLLVQRGTRRIADVIYGAFL